MRIPIGFRFNPSDETLINGFLLPKVMGHPLPWNVIADTVVYGDNAAPWDVFSAADKYHWTTATTEAEVKHSTYVFTTLTRASANRISRRAGCGTWGGETCKDIVDSIDNRRRHRMPTISTFFSWMPTISTFSSVVSIKIQE